MNGIRNTAQQAHPLSKRVMLALIGLTLVTGCAGRSGRSAMTLGSAAKADAAASKSSAVFMTCRQ